jgi:hypothetical protein
LVNLEICLSAFGGEIIQFENYSIWKWGNGEICLSAFGGEIIQFACRPMAEKLVNLEMGKFACRPLVEKWGNLESRGLRIKDSIREDFA